MTARVEDYRTVPCEVCGTEGRIYVADWVYDRNAGGMIPDQRDIGPCEACEGTGGELIETQPIKMEDLPGEDDYARFCREKRQADHLYRMADQTDAMVVTSAQDRADLDMWAADLRKRARQIMGRLTAEADREAREAENADA